jgi:hypothetical protein
MGTPNGFAFMHRNNRLFERHLAAARTTVTLSLSPQPSGISYCPDAVTYTAVWFTGGGHHCLPGTDQCRQLAPASVMYRTIDAPNV